MSCRSPFCRSLPFCRFFTGAFRSFSRFAFFGGPFCRFLHRAFFFFFFFLLLGFAFFFKPRCFVPDPFRAF
jgi:hypothetical protein